MSTAGAIEQMWFTLLDARDRELLTPRAACQAANIPAQVKRAKGG